MHIGHVPDVWPALMPYLALAPGYRFIIDDEGYEDIWHEPVITKK
ncbi:immunity protein Imm33 domain-containing protein [Delftia lacustris]